MIFLKKVLDFLKPPWYYKQAVERQRQKLGGIAQLGERLNGIQEVSGSIPLISTIEALKTIGFQGFFRCAELFLSPRGTLLTHI